MNYNLSRVNSCYVVHCRSRVSFASQINEYTSQYENKSSLFYIAIIRNKRNELNFNGVITSERFQFHGYGYTV